MTLSAAHHDVATDPARPLSQRQHLDDAEDSVEEERAAAEAARPSAITSCHGEFLRASIRPAAPTANPKPCMAFNPMGISMLV
jgi:hypothetical protein